MFARLPQQAVPDAGQDRVLQQHPDGAVPQRNDQQRSGLRDVLPGGECGAAEERSLWAVCRDRWACRRSRRVPLPDDFAAHSGSGHGGGSGRPGSGQVDAGVPGLPEEAGAAEGRLPQGTSG
uniref:(northern house mosquito) hypothetical protein n=1 Tax=Culex pipiens TaxID=7175 RepID=A0A8D8K6J3_CULPI